MGKRSSLFSSQKNSAVEPAPIVTPSQAAGSRDAERRYPVAKTREGKRVASVYLEPEALKQLQRLALEEDVTLQDLLVEGVNAVFQARGLSRLG